MFLLINVLLGIIPTYCSLQIKNFTYVWGRNIFIRNVRNIHKCKYMFLKNANFNNVTLVGIYIYIYIYH